jgi:hypothetical protein
MTQDNTSILIFNEHNKINPAFVKANRYVLLKYKKDFQNLNVNLKIQKLKDFWFYEYNAVLVDKNNKFYKIEFDSKVSLLLFTIKWGQF